MGVSKYKLELTRRTKHHFVSATDTKLVRKVTAVVADRILRSMLEKVTTF